jgi:hypothetical protein
VHLWEGVYVSWLGVIEEANVLEEVGVSVAVECVAFCRHLACLGDRVDRELV